MTRSPYRASLAQSAHSFLASAIAPCFFLPQLASARVAVDPAGMPPGTYTGVITVTNTSSVQARVGVAAAQPEQAVIPVAMVVLPAKILKLYLPLVLR